ncbi:MAG: RNA degradosome polyphosphate kinase [Deltaproteobacteria bacterium]|nr:MAG: RNA degradosome polyphosphate kinase [Deltaproteobacteria bacterium]
MTSADWLRTPFPQPVALPPEEIEGPRRFFNRELSWLAFNRRVLEVAEDEQVPLLERVRFLAISDTNLDEFFTVRVAGLRKLVKRGSAKRSIDGRTASEQLRLVDAEARQLMARQQVLWKRLRRILESRGIVIVRGRDLSDDDRSLLRERFLEDIFPVLSPIAIDPAHPFPFIPNGGLVMALRLGRANRKGKKDKMVALVPIPAQLPRFVPIERHEGGRLRCVRLERLLAMFVDEMFPRYRATGRCMFRVLRDSDLEIEEEAEDLVREFEVALKRRRRGEVVRLQISKDAPKGLRTLIMDELLAEPDTVVDVDGMIGLSAVAELIDPTRIDLLWPPFEPRVPERVLDHDGDMFAAIRQKDMLLHHPYETFDMVVQFIKQAAADPDVVAIKQTLYRTSRDSPIVDALCEAAESGKSVTAVVELKARFDEAANIRQSRRLERAGAHVVYGFLDYKTHAKMSLVVRQEGDRLRTYTHFGTGNYHPITARIYTDLSLFSADPALGRDSARVFNFITGYAEPVGLEHVAVAPIDLQEQVLELIEGEVENARAGLPAVIWAKMNALVERRIIEALYEASCAGVEINLVVRGICSLRPGISGLSERIRVKSIVGRFLEHSRILCVGNGHRLPHKKARVFISSADWMDRNFRRRVETMVECENPTVKAQILDQIMAANLADEANSWVLDPFGDYVRPPPDPNRTPFSCHEFFMRYPSLSGRGSAGAKDVPRVYPAPDQTEEGTPS